MPYVLFRLRLILTDTNTEWSIAFDQLGFERNTSSPLQSIDGGMGPALALSPRPSAFVDEAAAVTGVSRNSPLRSSHLFLGIVDKREFA
jgi:hypothetical protein